MRRDDKHMASIRVKFFGLLIILLSCSLVQVSCAHAQTVFSCASGFSSSGSCGVTSGSGQPLRYLNVSSGLSGSSVILVPSGTTHNQGLLLSTAKQNIQAFTFNFTFQGNGQNIS